MSHNLKVVTNRTETAAQFQVSQLIAAPKKEERYLPRRIINIRLTRRKKYFSFTKIFHIYQKIFHNKYLEQENQHRNGGAK